MHAILSQGLFYAVVQIIICFCVFGLFIAIFLDFALYSRHSGVEKEKKSVVETGTMTLFFFLFCIILRSRIGTIDVKPDLLKNLLIILGTAAIVTGCVINISGRFYLGRNWANHIKIYEEHTLIQVGIYKIVRHPLYASIMLMFYGASLVYRNVFSALAVSIVFIPFMYYRARQEEALLVRRFPEYEVYKRRTGMFFPRIFRERK